MSNNFGEIFEVELKCWCYGLSRVSEPVDSSVLHKVIKEFSPVLREAIENNYVCDIADTAKKLISYARSRTSEKEIIFYILSHLPSPSELTEEQAEVLYQTIDQVEGSYPGARTRLEKKWGGAREQGWQTAANPPPSFAELSFPPK